MAEEEQEQPVFSPSKSAMDLTASQQLAESIGAIGDMMWQREMKEYEREERLRRETE